MNPAAIVFDCDGVLFESTAANLAFYNTVLRQMGAVEVDAGDADRVRLCHTASSPIVLETLLGQRLGREALAYAHTLGYEAFIPHMQPEPGLTEALSQLAALVPLAVATNRGASIEPILQHFDLARHFSTVICIRDVPRPKPWPDMLWLAAERLQVRLEQMMFVGDSDLDRQAAESAGVPFVAYKSMGLGGRVIHSHGELLALVSEASSS